MKLYALAPDGPSLESEADARDVIGAAMGDDADLVAIPASRFTDAFFDLSTRFAGHFIQRLVTYGLRLAIVGDISAHTARSTALAAFVAESNRGETMWFVPDMVALTQRLER